MSKTICIFGDSITWGAFDRERGGWVEQLKMYFFKQDINVYNLGISGDNARKMVKRFKNECEIRKPDIIMIAIGINDSQNIKSTGGKRVAIGEFENNLQKIIIEGKKLGKMVFICPIKVDESKTAPISWNEDRTYLNEEILKYNAVIKVLCEENNLQFIEMFDLLNEGDLEDGLHPNSEGHRKMFERARDFLEGNKLV